MKGVEKQGALRGGEVSEALAEFAELNRRRVFGSPPLALAELERWLELRADLDQRFGDQLGERSREAEQRATQRLRTHLRVELCDGEQPSRADLRDISQGGLFIVTRRPLEVGSPIRLVVDGGTALRSVELSGVVTWVRESKSREGDPGMGVRFDDSEAQRASIARLVQDIADSG